MQIALSQAQFARLVSGEPLIFKAGDQRVELRLEFEGGAWRHTLQAVLGIGGDPPQAREFLPNRHTRRPYE
jgi:hypothetical protein